VVLATQVQEHYVSAFGRPDREAAFTAGELSIAVLKWSAETHPEGVAFYATLGASAFTPADAPEHRTEFFAGLLPENDGIAASLADLGSYPLREGRAIREGDTLSVGEPLWPGTEMTCYWVTRTASPVLAPLALPDLHVEFLQAIPLYESERRHLRSIGADEFLSAWEARTVPFWDPNRPATS